MSKKWREAQYSRLVSPTPTRRRRAVTSAVGPKLATTENLKKEFITASRI